MTGPGRSGPRVVALGGGHGLAATLEATRHYAGDVTAIVSVADDGGSSGRLRDAFGIPPPAICGAAWWPSASRARSGDGSSSTVSTPGSWRAIRWAT